MFMRRLGDRQTMDKASATAPAARRRKSRKAQQAISLRETIWYALDLVVREIRLDLSDATRFARTGS